MVAESIFLLLRWVEDPSATRIDQGTTIVHHNDTLEIGPRWYMELVDAVLHVLLKSIPPDHDAERILWLGVRDDIASFIDSLRPEFIRSADTRPLAVEP